ncbi:gas vesicle protein [Actinomadura sp. ATCC 31491]|uniref:Gas vesicle protein n=1 Tax=Actinomadura luzonensis TaxID=2805427 RepID=A0ABT0G9M8_9ACTN|nr:gas vesicle protein [Actinomadura luzonensis]MCK2221317.1 gas vesicle protein [Actinomadura luzonensis]
MSAPPLPATPGDDVAMSDRLPPERVSLVDLLDRLLAGGVALSGDIVLSIADVDLVCISLRTIFVSADKLEGA